MKRVISIVLAILTLLTVFVSCGKKNGDVQDTATAGTVSTGANVSNPSGDEDIPREQVPDNLPERNYNKAQFDILVQTYNAALDDFVVDDESTFAIDQAVRDRNLRVEERFGVKFEFYQSIFADNKNIRVFAQYLASITVQNTQSIVGIIQYRASVCISTFIL